MKRGFLILFLSVFSLFCSAQKIELEGRYQGKNIYVQNPAAGTGGFYCTDKVLVNGIEVPFKHSSAYEIRIDTLGLAIGDTVKVEIFHKPDCKPKVLNDNSSPKITFELTSISVDSSAVLHWTCVNESGKLSYIIEQFRWNKWIKVGEVDGKGGIQKNEYTFQTVPHSGENHFRFKQSYTYTCRLSKTALYKSNAKKVTYQHGHIGPEIIFSEETMYEVYDQEGNIMMKGTGKVIDCRKLPKSAYYLNYDNTLGEFIKSY